MPRSTHHGVVGGGMLNDSMRQEPKSSPLRNHEQETRVLRLLELLCILEVQPPAVKVQHRHLNSTSHSLQALVSPHLGRLCSVAMLSSRFQ